MQTKLEKLTIIGEAVDAINKALATYPEASESEIIELIAASAAQRREGRVVWYSLTRVHVGEKGVKEKTPERLKEILGI